ncbi:hypothetical protein QYF36_016501 [Acer negundo]|nr:hypothetical protein QYF36_016501 [Acer negundo]
MPIANPCWDQNPNGYLLGLRVEKKEKRKENKASVVTHSSIVGAPLSVVHSRCTLSRHPSSTTPLGENENVFLTIDFSHFEIEKRTLRDLSFLNTTSKSPSLCSESFCSVF